MPVKYILPDWDDYLDANFAFENDSFISEDGREKNHVYLHELMKDKTPYDGMLVSLNQIEKRKGALKKHGINGALTNIREIMRVPDKIRIIGDCGAFSYKDKDKPSITPEEAARIYHEYGFNVGASVDHMVIDEIEQVDREGNRTKHILTQKEKDDRVELTIKNAQAFINAVNENQYTFTPMGSIQARTANEYADVFSKYIDMGYRQVALGSLIPKNDEEIRNIILAVGARYRALQEDIRNDVGIHLFGVLRPALFPLFAENGITSFDSASYFRKAWLKSDKNYLGSNKEWYPAIRVPQSDLPKNRKALEKAGKNLEEVAALESEVMRRLTSFENDDDIEELLDLIMEYDALFERISDGGDKLKESYKRVLGDRPWEQCECEICRTIGINALIFRGYNRNKRRGFHNVYVFYNDLNGGTKDEHK